MRLKRFHFFKTVIHVAVETVYSNIYIMNFFFSNEKSLYFESALRLRTESGRVRGVDDSRYGGCFKRNGTVILNTNILLIPLRKKNHSGWFILIARQLD